MIDKINDIRKALENKTYIAAVALALTLPDICSQVENNTSESSRSQYIDWVNKRISPDYFVFDLPGFEDQVFAGNMCYSLRCNVLHSGSTDVANPKLNVYVDRFLLVKPGDPNYLKGFSYSVKTQDDGTIIKTNRIGIDYLCECLCDIAEEFYNQWPDKSDFDDHTFATE